MSSLNPEFESSQPTDGYPFMQPFDGKQPEIDQSERLAAAFNFYNEIEAIHN